MPGPTHRRTAWLIVIGMPCLLVVVGLMNCVAVAQQRSVAKSSSAQRTTSRPPDELLRRFEAARAAKEAGDLAGAAAASRQVIALGLREMGRLRSAEAMYPQAAVLYRHSLDFEDLADTHRELATAFFFSNEFDEALAETGKALASDPRNPETWTLHGEAQIKKKDYRGAVESLQHSLALRPDGETSYALANCYLRLKEKEKGAAIFRQMAAAAGERSDIYLLFGTAYRDAGMTDDAIEQFQHAIALNPKIPGAHYLLGFTYLMRNEWGPSPEAHSEFLKELQLNPRNFAANYLLGYMAFSANQSQEADHYLGIAAALNPNSAESWLYLGLNAYRRKDVRRTEELLRKAIQLAERQGTDEHQDVRKAYTTLGRILITSGRKEEGRQYLQKARAMEDRIIVDAQEGSGMGSGVSSTAVPNLPQDEPKVALAGTSKDPAAPLDPKWLAGTKLTPPQKKAAADQEKYLRSVLGASFNDLATAEAMQENFADALRHYQEAERWDAAVPNLMRNLGFAAYKVGDRNEAIRALKKAVAVSPGDAAARDVLKELTGRGSSDEVNKK